MGLEDVDDSQAELHQTSLGFFFDRVFLVEVSALASVRASSPSFSTAGGTG